MLARPQILARLSRPAIAIPHLGRAAMSTAPKKYEWFCMIPDHPDALPRRVAVRDKHFARIGPLVESGFLNFGGAYLHDQPHPENNEPPTFRGSVLTCVAESKEEVIAILKKDVYTTENVWDWEKAQIFPFKCAVRLQLPQSSVE